ncbi:hypothetical protein Q8F55_007580 [Vanrija albida]|uniref:Arylamine N-acetyltransferase n=1 Tax=Vanrija albida TaxID=181172 RepID=A0ABR3PTW8_9TREE
MTGPLTDTQLDAYLARISFPRALHPADPLALLTQVHSHHLAFVPFESLSIHYNPARPPLLKLAPDALFDKIVTRKRGGYCVEVNQLFRDVLRSLGFTVLPVSARVSHSAGGVHDGGFLGYSHMANLIDIAGARYLVDVGFGPDVPPQPLKLVYPAARPGWGPAAPADDEEATTSLQECDGVAPQRFRIAYRRLKDHTDAHQRAWVLSTRRKPDADWLDCYAFDEFECFPPDYGVMNWSTNVGPESFFVRTVIAQRFLTEQELAEEDASAPYTHAEGAGRTATLQLAGTIALAGNTLRRRIHGVDEAIVATIATEAERVALLEKYFGVVLSKEEQEGIRGDPTEIVPAATA